jgi:GPH family glycoside/pentoside/hexuronide:cation symporter
MSSDIELKPTKEPYENSKKSMVSYGFTQFFGQWITGSFGLFVFYFYEVVIGLPVIMAALAFILYSIWNAINDPLFGYLMERLHMPWERKWGVKRVPWIIIGAIPWLFSYLFIFLVPKNFYGNQWAIFTWYVVTLFVYDTLYTLWNVNATAMFPDKFRGLNERRTSTGIGTIIGMIGIVCAMIIPPLFVIKDAAETYQTMAWFSIGIGFILFFIMLPGINENERMRERYKRSREKLKTSPREPFFKTTKRVISDKTFMVKVIFFFGYQAAAMLIQTSGAYIVTFILNKEMPSLSLILGAMLLGAMISMPFWTYISKKLDNNKRLELIAGWVMFFTFIPLMFGIYLGYLGYAIALFIWGIGLGAQWFADPPAMGDVLDNIAVKIGRREDAVYYGWNAFFIRLSIAFQALVFAIVHSVTGFVEGAKDLGELNANSPTPALAQFGIIIHSAIIPAIVVLITIFIFWKWYDLTPDKVAKNKEKLKEMGL